MKKLLTRTLAMVMTIVMLLSMAVFTASADEVLPSEDFVEENGVFHIENASDMMAFSGMAEWYEWYAGKTVSIDANIDMTGASWVMIPNFKGILEGNGNCIKNLVITSTGQVSIFKNLTNATVRNLRFLDCAVTSTGTAGTIGGLSVTVTGETLIENVYMDTTVDTGTAQRPGGFFAYTNVDANVTFKNCVSDATLKGSSHGGGFIAQHANKGAKVEFIDCAFIGDLSGVALKRSTGFVGITDADTKFTRCLSLGKNSDNVNNGDFANLIQQSAQKPNKTKIEIIDCYGVTAYATQRAVVLENLTGMDISLTYGGNTIFSKEVADADTAMSDTEKASLDSKIKYLIEGDTVNFTKDNFKTLYPAFANWTVTDVTVEYAEGKTMPAIIPTSIVTLLAGSTDVPTGDDQTPGGDANQTPDPSDKSDEGDETETKAPETSDTKAETNAVTEDVEEDKGCGGVIGAGAIAIIAVAGAAVVATRKKED